VEGVETAESTFAAQTTLTADDEVAGRYRVDVSHDWDCPTVPQGGVMSAIAARAMELELARPGSNGNGSGAGAGSAGGQTLRSLTTVYAAPVPAGPVTIDVGVLRRGRSMSQLSATVRTAASPDVGHTSLAVFGRDRAGFSFTDLVRPDVPAPEDCPSFRDPVPDGVEMGEPFAFWTILEGRPAMGHAPWDDYTPTSSETATWQRFDQPPRRADGSLDPLMLVCMADTMPASVSERMGRIDTMWYPPSADLTVHLLDEPRSEWILCHKRARWAGDGYASIEMALWDPDPAVGLVAHACQVMFVVFPDGPPPPAERLPLDQRPG
jgi:acyl-CoA thioesterase